MSQFENEHPSPDIFRMLSNWEAGRSFKPARNASKASGQQGTESMKPRGGALREEPNACCKAFPQFATVSS